MDTPEPLKIVTLGKLSIVRGAGPVTGLVSRKVEALFVYLAYERREYPREMLAELLWDELTTERALGNLRTALSNIQAHLPDYLLTSRQTVMANPAKAVWFDALELMRVLDVSEAPFPAADDLEKALALYQGDFLAGFHLRDELNFERWMIGEAERLRGKMSMVLPRLIDAALDQARYPVAIDHARRLLTLDPLSEDGHRGLMMAFAYAGQRALALKQYELCVRVLHDELHTAPEAETTRLFSQIQNDQFSTPPSAASAAPLDIESKPPVIRLPTMPTPFIERPTELGQITDRLANPDCRLLTIVGPGGTGKTRLAIQAAAACGRRFKDGIYFVPLASIPSEAFLVLEIAGVLGLAFGNTDEPRRTLLDYLSERQQLLVLDNFEHLIESGGLIADILSGAPGVKLLVTSREWLNLLGEWVLPIDGMAYPDASAPDASGYSAIRLFAACAARIQPRFLLKDELDAVIAICKAVEGMPLSIELAATWLRAIPAVEIAKQISVKFLSTGARNLPERHRSVQAVFDYSWQLMTATEATILMKLAVFRGSFSRAAAIEVAGASLLSLASLLEKSLIRRLDEHSFDMHELLRQYAFDHLADAGQVELTRDAHLAYYVAYTADPDARVHGQKQIEWLDQLEHDHENLRAALTWALECGAETALMAGLDIGGSVWEFWLMRGHISEGRGWLDRLLAATPGLISDARGKVTQGAGYLTWIQGDSDRAEAIHREGLAIRRALGDKAGMGGSLSNLGVIAWGRGDFKAARDFYEQALTARREANYRIGMASVLTNLSLLLQDQAEYRDAIAYATEALSLFTELDDLQGKALVLFNIGSMTYDRGDWASARKLQEEALTVTRALGDRRMIGALLQNLGYTVLSLGDRVLARKLLAESFELVTESGDKTQLALVKLNQAKLAMLERHFAAARDLVNESLALFGELKAEVYRGQALITLGDILRVDSSAVRAVNAYRDAFANLAQTQNQRTFAESVLRLAGMAQAQSDLKGAGLLLAVVDKLTAQLDITFPDELLYIDRAALYRSLSSTDRQRFATQAAAMDRAALVAFVDGA